MKIERLKRVTAPQVPSVEIINGYDKRFKEAYTLQELASPHMQQIITDPARTLTEKIHYFLRTPDALPTSFLLHQYVRIQQPYEYESILEGKRQFSFTDIRSGMHISIGKTEQYAALRSMSSDNPRDRLAELNGTLQKLYGMITDGKNPDELEEFDWVHYRFIQRTVGPLLISYDANLPKKKLTEQ